MITSNRVGLVLAFVLAGVTVIGGPLAIGHAIDNTPATTAAPAPSASAPDQTATPTPTPSTPSETTPSQTTVQKDAWYDTAKDLYDAITSSVDGLGAWQPDATSKANSDSSGQDAGENISIYVYTDRATLVSDVNLATLGDDDEVDSVLVGQNWMIVGAKENLDLLQPTLGGEHPTWAAKSEPSKPKPKATLTREQEEAIEAAESYLNSGHFSRAGLIDQLSSKYGEDFPKKVATFAVDHVHADWNAEAVQAANSYLESGHFSRRALINQLESPYGEHFTHKQAVYGVNHSDL